MHGEERGLPPLPDRRALRLAAGGQAGARRAAAPGTDVRRHRPSGARQAARRAAEGARTGAAGGAGPGVARTGAARTGVGRARRGRPGGAAARRDVPAAADLTFLHLTQFRITVGGGRGR
ncbi:hypothetical protein LZG43_18055 [Streptomyces thermodiastaticus]|nr:hypothetical protein [Streptomyces thermodiastaticus]